LYSSSSAATLSLATANAELQLFAARSVDIYAVRHGCSSTVVPSRCHTCPVCTPEAADRQALQLKRLVTKWVAADWSSTNKFST
jgi:hypothetical protein